MDKLEINVKTRIENSELREQISTFGLELTQLIETLGYIRLEATPEQAKRPSMAWQLKKAFIHSLASKHPNVVHFTIAQAAIAEEVASNGQNAVKNTDLVGILAHALAENICVLNERMNLPKKLKDITAEASRIADEKSSSESPALEVIDWSDCEVEGYFEKDELFLFDHIFLEHLEGIGEASREMAKLLKPMLEKRFKTFKEKNKNYFGFWFNIKPSNEKPFFHSDLLCLLARALWRDKASNSLPKIGVMRVSGHIADQKLLRKKKQIPSQKTHNNIIEVEEWEPIHEGLTNLSILEHKAISALHVLLHLKSQTANEDADDFYKGNETPQIIKIGETILHSPVIRFTKPEYYKAFTGKEKYSGKDQETADKALAQLAPRKFLTIWERKKTVARNEVIEELFDRAELYKPLFEKITIFKDLTSKQKDQVHQGDKKTRERKGEEIFAMNPIFRDQIETKYLRYPVDLTSRIRKASCKIKCKETPSTYCLITYLARAHSGKCYTTEISEQVLIKTLELEKIETEKRKKRISSRINCDIQIAIEIGLVEKYSRVARKNPGDGYKYIFYLNQEWPEGYTQRPIKKKRQSPG